MQSLEYIFLHTTQVNDLSPLSRLQNLVLVHCGHTPVTDLSPLDQLPKLQELNALGSSIGSQEIERFKTIRPALRIPAQYR